MLEKLDPQKASLAIFVVATATIAGAWIFQFAGHYAEKTPPEFFHDWCFLFVGLRWWWAKVRGKA